MSHQEMESMLQLLRLMLCIHVKSRWEVSTKLVCSYLNASVRYRRNTSCWWELSQTGAWASREQLQNWWVPKRCIWMECMPTMNGSDDFNHLKDNESQQIVIRLPWEVSIPALPCLWSAIHKRPPHSCYICHECIRREYSGHSLSLPDQYKITQVVYRRVDQHKFHDSHEMDNFCNYFTHCHKSGWIYIYWVFWVTMFLKVEEDIGEAVYEDYSDSFTVHFCFNPIIHMEVILIQWLLTSTSHDCIVITFDLTKNYIYIYIYIHIYIYIYIYIYTYIHTHTHTYVSTYISLMWKVVLTIIYIMIA